MSCISKTFLSHLLWCWSRIFTKSGISNAKGRSRGTKNTKHATPREPPQCTSWCRDLDALVYRVYWDFFCPPHCFCTGFLCAFSKMQRIESFARLRGRQAAEMGWRHWGGTARLRDQERCGEITSSPGKWMLPFSCGSTSNHLCNASNPFLLFQHLPHVNPAGKQGPFYQVSSVSAAATVSPGSCQVSI